MASLHCSPKSSLMASSAILQKGEMMNTNANAGFKKKHRDWRSG
jgi:hypothetical protein